MGHVSMTITGKHCKEWPSDNDNGTHVNDDVQTSLAGRDKCRNQDLRAVGPHCFVGDNVIERCDIPFCGRPMSTSLISSLITKPVT